MKQLFTTFLSLRPWEATPELRRLAVVRREQLWREASRKVKYDVRFWFAAATVIFVGLTLAFAADGVFRSPLNPGLPKSIVTVTFFVTYLAFASISVPLVLHLLIRESLQRIVARYCPACGYDLTANASGVCPECGRAVDCPVGDKVE